MSQMMLQIGRYLKVLQVQIIPYFPAYKIPANNVAKIPELLNQTHNSVRFETWNKDDNCST